MVEAIMNLSAIAEPGAAMLDDLGPESGSPEWLSVIRPFEPPARGRSYSSRNAITGSTRIARRAGT